MGNHFTFQDGRSRTAFLRLLQLSFHFTLCLDTWQPGSLKLFEENLIQSFLKLYCDLVKKCQVILSIILTLLLGKLSWLDIIENLDVLTLKKNSYSDLCRLTLSYNINFYKN